MTPALRRYHQQVWFFLAGFLPLVFVAGILVIPQNKAAADFQGLQPAALPKLIATVQGENFRLNLLTDQTDTRRQLEISVRNPMTSPASLVYISEKKFEEGILLGELSSVGKYRFELGMNQHYTKNYVWLFDPVKNRVIQDFEL
jgi:hypothetical protein